MILVQYHSRIKFQEGRFNLWGRTVTRVLMKTSVWRLKCILLPAVKVPICQVLCLDSEGMK